MRFRYTNPVVFVALTDADGACWYRFGATLMADDVTCGDIVVLGATISGRWRVLGRLSIQLSARAIEGTLAFYGTSTPSSVSGDLVLYRFQFQVRVRARMLLPHVDDNARTHTHAFWPYVLPQVMATLDVAAWVTLNDSIVSVGYRAVLTVTTTCVLTTNEASNGIVTPLVVVYGTIDVGVRSRRSAACACKLWHLGGGSVVPGRLDRKHWNDCRQGQCVYQCGGSFCVGAPRRRFVAARQCCSRQCERCRQRRA